jgi:transcriptional regulator with XRE-family HTH domain
MDSVNERVKQLRSLLKMTQVNFSKKIYISQGSYNDIEKGIRRVNDRIIQLICSEFNVSKEWLKYGKGGMFDEVKPDIRLENLIEIYKQLDSPLQEYLIQQSEVLLQFNNENTIKKKQKKEN